MPASFSISIESSTHFKALFESATTGILITNDKGLIIALNPCVSDEFGFTEDELVGERIERLIPSLLSDRVVDMPVQASAKSAKHVLLPEEEIYGVRKDGSKFYADVSVNNYKNNELTYFVVFVSNISARKAAETKVKNLTIELEKKLVRGTRELRAAMKELQKSKSMLEDLLSFQKALLDTAGAIIIATDEKGIIRLFNPEAEIKLGYKQSEVVGKETPLLFHNPVEIERKKNEIFKLTGKAIKSNFDVLIENATRGVHTEEQYSYMRKSGASLPVSLTITAMRDSDQKISGFIGIAIDITERIRAEKELKKLQRLFLQLLHNYPDGAISIVDRNCNFVYTGGELHKQLQSDIGQLIGKEMYPRFPEPLRDMIFEKVAKVFENKNPISGFELPVQIMNHTYIMDVFPLIEEDASLNYAGVIIKNVTKLKAAEVNLREALQKERKLGELKSRFVSMASHEFRTPLSTVLSSAYLIEKYMAAEDQPKRERHLQRIVSSVNMLTDTLNEFLNIGKIEEGKINPRFSEFNMEGMIRGVVDEMMSSLRKEQRISYEHRGDPMITLDASLLKHILLNLISNASKFSPESSAIEINTVNQNGSATLSVKDRGIGISEEDQEHLAERFFRGANVANIQGTGLGLHIISKYAEMMNGEVRCISRLDEGTEFIITFHTKQDYHEKNTID